MRVITCTCRPADGFHQEQCDISVQMRIERIEAGKPKVAPDPTKRAQVEWVDPFTYERRSCGWFRHNWDEGDGTCGTGCETGTVRYTCRTCGKTKDRGGA